MTLQAVYIFFTIKIRRVFPRRGRRLRCGGLLALSCLFASSVFGEIDLGNRGALAFGFDGKAEYDSNISSNSGEEDDLLWVGLPKVLYRFNEGALYVDAYAGVQFRKYSDNSQFDSENLQTGLQLLYPHDENDRNFELDFRARFEESTSADDDLQAIVEKDRFFANLGGKYFFTDRYYLHTAFRFRDEEVKEAGFNDVSSITLPLSIFYRYSDALDIGAGVQYRETTVDGTTPAADSSDLAVFLAATGPLTPSIEGDARVGLQSRDFDAGEFDDDDSVFMEIGLTWRVSERSAVEWVAGNELETSAANQSVERFYTEAGLRHQFDDKISGKAALGYSEKDYSSLAGDGIRNDESWMLTVGGDYELIADRLSLNALIRYLDQQSDSSNADYNQTVVELGVSFIY